MKLALIGLGRMGMALALHALEDGFDVVAYNRNPEKVKTLATHNFEIQTSTIGTLTPAYSVKEVIHTLPAPRIILLMVPASSPPSPKWLRRPSKASTVAEAMADRSAGKPALSPVDEVIGQLVESGLSAGDTIIDGGNSFYKDSVRRYGELKEKGIHFLDMGTSGGIEGARKGACLTIGGDKEVFEKIEPLFKALAVPHGYGYVGPSGAGHFVKVTHNGVEYGMLQAIGEGFAVLEKGPYALDFHQIAKIWNHGSVVRGWLMELAERAFQKDPKLESIEGVVGGGETGRWTVDVANKQGVTVPVLEASLKARQDSQKMPTFAGKVIAALRNEFGQHETKKKNSHTTSP